MSTLETNTQHTLNELENVISRAMERVHAKKETDLRYYLPGEEKDKKLHHLSFLKLKATKPLDFIQMIKEHILNRDDLTPLEPKPVSLQTVNKEREVKLKPSQINRMAKFAREIGDLDLLLRLSPQQTLPQVKKLMVDMIQKEKLIEPELLNTYNRLIEENKTSRE